MPQVCGFARTVRPGLGPAPAAVPVRPVPVVMLLVAVLFGVSGWNAIAGERSGITSLLPSSS